MRHSEELNRPENKDLTDIVRKLESAKGAIDATSAAASMGFRFACVARGEHVSDFLLYIITMGAHNLQ